MRYCYLLLVFSPPIFSMDDVHGILKLKLSEGDFSTCSRREKT